MTRQVTRLLAKKKRRWHGIHTLETFRYDFAAVFLASQPSTVMFELIKCGTLSIFSDCGRNVDACDHNDNRDLT